jgi:hypothetical protein
MVPNIHLDRLAISAKILISLFLLSMTLNHIFALLLGYHITHEAFSSTEEYYYYQQDTRKLLRMSHQHSFGHGIMYFILGGLFYLTRTKETWKKFLIPLPFIGAGLDQTSWWLIKFKSVHWEWLSYLGGTLLSIGFAVMAGIIFYQTWFLRNSAESKDPLPSP